MTIWCLVPTTFAPNILHLDADTGHDTNADINADIPNNTSDPKILYATNLCKTIYLSGDSVANNPASLFYECGSSLQPPVCGTNDI
ncbi:hypothetical protein PVK06_040761 [Gossypium arboreum]|uniref:Uncharacterized protein n=1 Tax=Gossypium arboreum TaxID=29729 RepID=A0ABR0N8J5_GOSAR|nr:hypothetical protein PVK06_040761 [Gossypium arboreum]